MPKRKKNKKTSSNLEELIVIALADSLDEAKEFESLLQNNDIPSMVKKQTDVNTAGKIAIMVPEEYADEAQVIIESQSSFDDIYEMTTDDEDEFGIEPIDDEFEN